MKDIRVTTNTINEDYLLSMNEILNENNNSIKEILFDIERCVFYGFKVLFFN